MKKEFISPEYIPVFSIALHDDNLQKIDCLVLGTIYWYERLKDGKCFASNTSIAKVVGAKNPTSISNSLKILEGNGYVQCIYKDSQKRHRKEIVCLIDRLNKKQTHPQMTPDSSTDDTVDSSTDEQKKNSIEKNIIKNSSELSSHIDEIIKQFEELNIQASRWYGNKTQRAAAKNLIERCGYENVLKMIRVVKSNRGKTFTQITTVQELESKWTKLVAEIQRLRGNTQQKNKLIFA